jgi:transposase
VLAEKVQEVTGESVEIAFVGQGCTGDDPDADVASYGIHLVEVSLPEAKKGFVLLPKRWVVERSYGWMARFRRLAGTTSGSARPWRGCTMSRSAC